MKEIMSTRKDGGFDPSKLMKKIIIGVFILILLLLLISSGQILFFLQMFGWLENKVRMTTGLDLLLAKGIAAILMALFFILPVGSLIMSFFPLPVKNKRVKRFAVLIIFAAFFLAAFISSRNVFFDPGTGKPMKYYSITPTGEFKFYSSDGFDPLTGDKLQTVNKNVVIEYLKKSPQGKSYGYHNNPGELINDGTTLEEIIKGKTLIGAEKYARVYPVKFINQTGSTIFLIVNTRLASKYPVIIQTIPNGKKVVLDLMEGRHFLGCLNMSGDYYRNLKTGDNFFAASNIHDEYPQFDVKIQGKDYYVGSIYGFDVNPDKGLKIELKQKYVMPEGLKIFLILVLFMTGIIFVAILYAAGSKLSNS